jgi:hypothetical protein
MSFAVFTKRISWLPWKYFVRKIALSKGFIDPLLLLTRLQNFAQPSEVEQPIELLRAGVLFHARGLINTKAIQHNLDWIWPYWVERQFNPHDPSFIPRAFSITHINLTHRNWTALGLPQCPYLPLVDPAGLITPFYDGWSLDAWLWTETGPSLLPSKMKDGKQHVSWDGFSYRITTEYQKGDAIIKSIAEVIHGDDGPVLSIHYTASAPYPCWLVLSVRPYNPEGISFVETIDLSADRKSYAINNSPVLLLSESADHSFLSTYQQGDVFLKLPSDLKQDSNSVTCQAGMATAAAVYEILPKQERILSVRIPLKYDKVTTKRFSEYKTSPTWENALHGLCLCRVPDTTFQNLYESAIRTLLLHSPGEVYPGPYTYKRFWFRDSAFMLNALLAAGMFDIVEKCLDIFPGKQNKDGYFLSQEGEWDSNGEALWAIARYVQVTGRGPKENWIASVRKGADWIICKRQNMHSDPRLKGLLPAGFSAEHLGLNDYYYWDDFWGVAGLQAAADIMASIQSPEEAQKYRHESELFLSDIHNSIALSAGYYGQNLAVTASPLRHWILGGKLPLKTMARKRLAHGRDFAFFTGTLLG